MATQTPPYVGVLFDPALVRESDFFHGIVRYAKPNQWRVLVGEETLSLPRLALNRWPGNGVVGFLRDRAFVEALARARIPAVNAAQVGVGWGIPSVLPDHAETGRMVAQYFLERGFRHFAYCVEGKYAYRDNKLKGFSQRLSEFGFSCAIVSQPLTLPERRSWAQHRTQLMRRLRQLPKQVAVWARTDRFAARIVEACVTGGLSVPEEVAVMGFGDEKDLCPYIHPELASIDISYEDIGYQAAALLERLMHGDRGVPDEVFIAPRAVVERGSSDVMARLDPLLSKALHYIERHACDPVWVENVLEHTGMNRRHLERLFKRHLHRSPNTEIVRIRVRRARHLLAETDMSLSEVADACGFADYSSLRKAFKRTTSLTPRTYRRSRR